MKPTIIGREKEQLTLQALIDSKQPEFLAIYGRRRVGKTHLIREFFEPRVNIFFSVTGQNGASLTQQLHHFKQALEKTFYSDNPLPAFNNWHDALSLLAENVDRHLKNNSTHKLAIFIDELPWLATRRSGLVPAIDLIWNTRLSRLPAVSFIVCGSAASWMIEQLIQNKGGLHNRVTARINLKPFDLVETKVYLAALGVKMSTQQIIELYMAIGGIPYYLNQIKKGQSSSQAIADLCFDQNGLLYDEFDRLFSALFGHSDIYENIVRTIAKKKKGVLRDELIALVGQTTGGTMQKRLRECEEAGFITQFVPYGQQRRDTAFRIIDPYVFFYLKWIDKAPRGIFANDGRNYWQNQRSSPTYSSWSGYAFESLCLNHINIIKAALGLQQVSAIAGTWHYVTTKNKTKEMGAQIDLLLDRDDGIITICELKYSDKPFTIDKKYATELKRKIDIFESVSKTTKQVQLVMVTLNGFKPNIWSEDLVDNTINFSSVI